MQNIVERLLNGDRRALARMVTLIENEAPPARGYLAELHQHAGRAHLVGVTGAPGAGKSTLVTHLVRELRRRDRKVGVIAVDPTSPFTGGAILGDRIRMMELLKKEQVDDVLVAAGGILPNEDIPAIEAMGIKGCFGPGTSTEEIIKFVRDNINPDRLTTEV